MFRSVITGTGACIPGIIKANTGFNDQPFYTSDNLIFDQNQDDILKKFRDITGIDERRYLPSQENASDMAVFAAQQALADSGIDPETLDQIIVAHNFGNVLTDTIQSEAVPSLANRVKHQLGIKNPNCVAFDVLFGCPGWVQALIQANAFCVAGMAKRCLIVGAETLSRVVDLFDRDSMIFSDGAGACVMEWKPTTDNGTGVLSFASQSFSAEDLNYISMGKSFFPDSDPKVRYMKMQGRKVYEFAIKYVPAAMKECLDKSGIAIGQLKKVFLHQANEKMDEAIIKRFYQLYDIPEVPENIMPMSIHWLGNSSVATVPTLYDLVRRNLIPPHELNAGDVILFASVGAGMNISAVCYRY